MIVGADANDADWELSIADESVGFGASDTEGARGGGEVYDGG
jgi:hypothetical protein